jgi:hypothetical protein
LNTPNLFLLRATSPVPPQLRAFADANRSALIVARDIRARHRSNWEVDYVRGQGDDYPPFATLQTLSDALFVTALFDTEAGRADEAADAIVSGLSIAASMRQEPDVVIQGNRFRIGSRHVEALERLVADLEPSRPALAEVAHWLAENASPHPMQPGLLREVAEVNALLIRMENGEVDPNLASFLYPQTWPAWPKPWLGPVARWSRPLIRLAHGRYLRHMERLFEVQLAPGPRQPYPEPIVPERFALVDRLAEKFTQGKRYASEAGDRFTAELATAELAVALRRFRLDRGTYPDDLSVLVPAYLDRLPVDPYTGAPPEYARRGAGFALSARGDGRDYSFRRPIEWRVAK